MAAKKSQCESETTHLRMHGHKVGQNCLFFIDRDMKPQVGQITDLHEDGSACLISYCGRAGKFVERRHIPHKSCCQSSGAYWTCVDER